MMIEIWGVCVCVHVCARVCVRSCCLDFRKSHDNNNYKLSYNKMIDFKTHYRVEISKKHTCCNPEK